VLEIDGLRCQESVGISIRELRTSIKSRISWPKRPTGDDAIRGNTTHGDLRGFRTRGLVAVSQKPIHNYVSLGGVPLSVNVELRIDAGTLKSRATESQAVNCLKKSEIMTEN